MTSRRALERRLEAVAPFENPRADLEQYPTPADVAAHLLHLADLQGDLSGHTVVDLGTGTGVLAIAAACRSPARVVGLERDRAALDVARRNERQVDPTTDVAWMKGDARSVPLCPDGPTTVVANPPFGARDGARGADRPFLRAAARLSDVSYTVHNAGSESFVEAFAGDHGGTVTRAYEVDFDVERQFEFHDAARETLTVEAYRIDWES